MGACVETPQQKEGWQHLWMELQHWSGAAMASLLALLCVGCGLRKLLSSGSGVAYDVCAAGSRVGSLHNPRRSPRGKRLSFEQLPEPDPESESEIDPSDLEDVETSVVVYRDTVQSHQTWRPRFSESCGGVNVPEEDPSLAIALGSQRGSMSRSRRQSTGGRRSAGGASAGGVEIGVAVCREGYATASGRAMTGRGIFSAEFLFERGGADGAVIGIVRSDYDLLDEHLSRGGVPVLPVESPEGYGWGYHLGDGALLHRGSRSSTWMGTSHWAADPHLERDQGAETADRIRLTLDLDRGTLALHKNDARLGLLVAGGLREEIEGLEAVGYCWMVQLGSAGQAIRIAAPAGLAVRTGSGSP